MRLVRLSLLLVHSSNHSKLRIIKNIILGSYLSKEGWDSFFSFPFPISHFSFLISHLSFVISHLSFYKAFPLKKALIVGNNH